MHDFNALKTLMTRRKSAALLGGAMLAGMLSLTSGLAPALAQAPMRIVFPYAPGGGGDALARLLADGLGKELNEQVIVENRTGAGGRIGVAAVKEAAPDGRTLLVTPIAPMAVFQYFDPKLAYDPVKDFEPVTQIALFDFSLIVNKNVPVKNVQELVAWLKANPSKGNYGTPGAGTLPHFFAVGFGKTAAVDVNHISYRGSAAALSDLVSGQIPMLFTATSDVVAQHEAGEVRILATSGAKRSPFLKDVPTFKEAGFNIEGDGWYAIYAPAKTPAATIEKISAALQKVIKSEATQARFKPMGLVATGTTAAELAAIQKRDSDFWSKPVKDSGFKMD